MNEQNDKLMDGKSLANRLLEDVANKVKRVHEASGVQPCLATILVGDDPASATYVKMKGKRCEAVGMKSLRIEMPSETTTEELVGKITELGSDPGVHGILLQHPVPGHIDERAAFEAIPVSKDVDGVTSLVLGGTMLGMPVFGSCTPAGIMRLIAEYGIDLTGKEAVVVGRSPILGKPMGAMLLNANATVTICHSRTVDLPSVVARADVVVGAVGKPKFIQGDWIKEGAVVIDAGYNPGNVGDVDFDAALPKASLITPVPGGVGPMTIATLIAQTADAAEELLGG